MDSLDLTLRMKILRLFPGMVLLLGCGLSEGLSELPVKVDRKSERQTWDIVEHDFGILRPGTEVSHEFPIHNTGTRAVTVHEVQTTCSCTVAEVSSTRISPGKSESITVSYKSGELPSDDRRQVIVLFEEPWAHPTALAISAKVRNPLTPSKDRIAFGRIGHGDSASSVLEIQNFSEMDWQSITTTCTANWLTISVTV